MNVDKPTGPDRIPVHTKAINFALVFVDSLTTIYLMQVLASICNAVIGTNVTVVF